MKLHLLSLPVLLSMLALTSCQTPYYAAMEKVGVHKRDILIDRVEQGKEAQQEAKEQFASALERFSALTDFDGGSLQVTYDRLNRELERSEKRAAEVSSRIDAIEDVSKALFREWAQEIDEYQNESYRRISEEQLEQTRDRYDELIRVMKRAEASIAPVLVTFRDQVLFLKHNLNAQAIASLGEQSVLLKSDVTALLQEMEASIAEADAFISSMQPDA